MDDHRKKVKQVLAKLQEGGLTLDIMECEFDVRRTKYLGYIIDVEHGIRMDPDKVKAIQEWCNRSDKESIEHFNK